LQETFNRETAIQKIRLAEDGWNSRDAAKVALAYTTDTKWRNRSTFVTNREEAQAFLTAKWIKELEWHDDSGNWFRSYGNENWEFAESGLMQNRFASINDLPISEADRKYRWPLGRRPDDHPGLSDLGL